MHIRIRDYDTPFSGKDIMRDRLQGFSEEALAALGCQDMDLYKQAASVEGWTEFSSALECIEAFDFECDYDSCVDEDEMEDVAMEFLYANTEVIELSDSILIKQFIQPETEDD